MAGLSFLVTASLLALSTLPTAQAVKIPTNVQAFYDTAKSGACDQLAGGYHSSGADDGAEWAFCQAPITGGKAIYIKGNNKYVNMDIDCDGSQAHTGEGTPCGSSGDTQSMTAFKDTISEYGISDLDATIHPYVVFGKDGTQKFDPTEHGVEPLSVMAVVCGGKLIYGIWGDTNGNDGVPLVGEASISLANACFPEEGLNGDKGHGDKDVLYIAFTGADAVPGKSGADWKAGNYGEFEASIQKLGDKLVSRIPGGQARDPGDGSGKPTRKALGNHPLKQNGPIPLKTETPKKFAVKTKPQATCEWAGHCAGASCTDENDCSGALTCKAGRCAA